MVRLGWGQCSSNSQDILCSAHTKYKFTLVLVHLFQKQEQTVYSFYFDLAWYQVWGWGWCRVASRALNEILQEFSQYSEKVPTTALSSLKVLARAFTFKTPPVSRCRPDLCRPSSQFQVDSPCSNAQGEGRNIGALFEYCQTSFYIIGVKIVKH